jgi:hypothetical protein
MTPPAKRRTVGGGISDRTKMSFLNIILMNSPEQYIADVSQILGEDGAVTQEYRRKSLQAWTDAYAEWVRRFAPLTGAE